MTHSYLCKEASVDRLSPSLSDMLINALRCALSVRRYTPAASARSVATPHGIALPSRWWNILGRSDCRGLFLACKGCKEQG